MGVKKQLRMNFEYLQKMTIPEYTLYRKWEDLNQREWTIEERQRMWEVKNSLWQPTHPDDYLKIEPLVINVTSKADSLTWNILRNFIHSQTWRQNVGRIMRFTIMDKRTNTYLGVLSVASDFISLSPRDSYVGWDYDKRINKRMLNYTAMGSSIVPTQPLGFNYVGGKLLTLILCSDKVVDAWNEKYGHKQKLVAITTTSLYGGFSQYNNLKHWRKCGSTKGKIPMEPSDIMYQKIRTWVKEKYPKDFIKMTVNKNKILSRPKNKLLTFGYKKLGVKPPDNDAPRGVYFCRLYEKSNEFLSMKDKDWGPKLFDNRLQILTNLWKERYAGKRIKRLQDTGRNELTSSLFYDKLIGISWNEVKEKYLSEVGR